MPILTQSSQILYMALQKTLLVIIICLLLGQSVLASADVHLVFEETNQHHQDHGLENHDDVQENEHSSDDCGHCCHSHGVNLSIHSQEQGIIFPIKTVNISPYLNLLISHIAAPSFRPPIA